MVLYVQQPVVPLWNLFTPYTIELQNVLGRKLWRSLKFALC